MTDQAREIATATNLMRMALALLDKAGEGASVTACHLQGAIDAAAGAQPMQEGDALTPEQEALLDRLARDRSSEE